MILTDSHKIADHPIWKYPEYYFSYSQTTTDGVKYIALFNKNSTAASKCIVEYPNGKIDIYDYEKN